MGWFQCLLLGLVLAVTWSINPGVMMSYVDSDGFVDPIPDVPGDVCASVMCGTGRVCAMLEDGSPTCVCQTSCSPNHYSPVCASNGLTYDNPCHMNMAMCIQGLPLHTLHDGPCTPDEIPYRDEDGEAKPMVCYQIERDQLRQLLIKWMKAQTEEDGLFRRGKDYRDVVAEKFQQCDSDGDHQVDTGEFVNCVEKNETVQELHTDETSHIMRGLCVDALIILADNNSDWILDLDEFTNCMDSNYTPPQKECSLEDKTYQDGAETRVKCNTCICACGNWVCTSVACKDQAPPAGEEEEERTEYEVQQGKLPSKEERQQLLRGFKASEHINLDQIENEVPVSLDVDQTPADDTEDMEAEEMEEIEVSQEETSEQQGQRSNKDNS